MVEFGEQLKRAREDKGLTQQSLAEKLYVTRQSVSHWECGDRFPDLPTTKKISEILDVSLDDLLSGNDMTKVVERNPVIDNKTGNELLIAIYALVVLARLLQLINVFSASLPVLNLANSMTTTYALTVSLLGILEHVLIIAAFSYGLIQAIKGSLTPSRAGMTLVTYFCIVLVYNLVFYLSILANHQWNFEILKLNLFNWLYYLIELAVGLLSAYFFFIRNSNKRIWPVLLLLVSVVKIFRRIIEITQIYKNSEVDVSPFHNSITTLAVDVLPSMLLFGLIIYQVITLYRKRDFIEKQFQTS